jgi:putative ABC transport system permease protein
MVMVVRERRREIGVIKAIGGTDFKVISQFVIESITLTFIGAVLGIVLGIATSGPLTKALVTTSASASTSETRGMGGPGGAFREAQQNLNEITGTVSPVVFASAVGITFLIAILGSAMPAWLIARVRPAEVLRTE